MKGKGKKIYRSTNIKRDALYRRPDTFREIQVDFCHSCLHNRRVKVEQYNRQGCAKHGFIFQLSEMINHQLRAVICDDFQARGEGEKS